MTTIATSTDQMLALMENAVGLFDNLTQMNQILISKIDEFKNMTKLLVTSYKKSKLDTKPYSNEQEPISQVKQLNRDNEIARNELNKLMTDNPLFQIENILQRYSNRKKESLTSNNLSAAAETLEKA